MRTLFLWKNDIIQIVRDPIMRLMCVAPLLLIVVFKSIVVWLVPLIVSETGLDLYQYTDYILVFVLLMVAGMSGIVTGFMMLDEKDGRIAELLSVTPLGQGYLMNRLLFSGCLTTVYSLMAYYVLSFSRLPFPALVFLTVALALYSAVIGLLLFNKADDKVKGLTLAKGLNLLNLFAFADLFGLSWLSAIAKLFPSYWLMALVRTPCSLVPYLMVLVSLALWLGWLIYRRRV
ncbi:MAG: hypothetical protein PHT08_08790 [Bacteroidales bacterium]|nr:hypothetical protein [Bacteroidales bacterium]